MKWISLILILVASNISASDLESYVSRVGKRLQIVADRPGLDFEYKIAASNVPELILDQENNTIAISVGLLQQLTDEAELAAALALAIGKLADFINIDRECAKYVAFAGYDPQALLDIQEQYFYASNASLPHWLQAIYKTPITAGTLTANRLMINKLPKGLQRGAEIYHREISN